MPYKVYWTNLYFYHSQGFAFLFDAIQFGKSRGIPFRVDHGWTEVIVWTQEEGFVYLKDLHLGFNWGNDL